MKENDLVVIMHGEYQSYGLALVKKIEQGSDLATVRISRNDAASSEVHPLMLDLFVLCEDSDMETLKSLKETRGLVSILRTLALEIVLLKKCSREAKEIAVTHRDNHLIHVRRF